MSDSGIGIPESKKEHLFHITDGYKINGTSGEKGSGLGLIICKEFVEKHGGMIWVESESGKGSTFYFTLPAEEKKS
ncbi:MAG: ATP-binding protein [Candidatus Marinimicrobia bacterium]|nr:ATP-binding protein [Candidatus Neomarinimicrobiota bacterium]